MKRNRMTDSQYRWRILLAVMGFDVQHAKDDDLSTLGYVVLSVTILAVVGGFALIMSLTH